MPDNRINIKNKKAYFDFEILEKFIAGMELTGTEIKSIRNGKASLADSYCYFKNNELWVKGMRISEYTYGNYLNHDPYRERKLLLNRNELNRLEKKVKEKGLTISTLRLFINDKNLAKLEIALVKGKKEYDKRETIKQKDLQREMDRLGRIR
ncbi:MAG: SsrA-binding protein [Bacteroides sp. SM23_62_1]|nr:MAG: SsrA-binding protein [Bacteroides sp. SM23_62_1]